jgi:transaldolase
MELFVDSANLQDIENALKRGFSGITTNPSLLAKEPKNNFQVHVGKIVDLIQRYNPMAHLSVEVFSRDPNEILNQAKIFKKNFGLANLSVKIHIGWDELEVIKKLSDKGISVNCTCNMIVSQAVMAAAAGARFVSLFWGRIRDGGESTQFIEKREKLLKDGVLIEDDFKPEIVVRKTREIFDKAYPDASIIAGSMRSVNDIISAGLAGAHIVTVPPKFFPAMVSHFKTDEVVNQFLTDFKKWLE